MPSQFWNSILDTFFPLPQIVLPESSRQLSGCLGSGEYIHFPDKMGCLPYLDRPRTMIKYKIM